MADESTSEVTRSGTFASSPDKLWSLVSDFGGLDKIMAGLESFEVAGEGIGSERKIGMGGGIVHESLDVFDDENKTLTYSIIDSPLPFKDYSATMTVAAEGEGSSLTWTGRFAADGAPAADAEALAGQIYDGGIAGYAKALGEQRPA